MGRIRHRWLVWCLLSVVLLAPLAAPVGAAGSDGTDEYSITDENWSSEHGHDHRESSVRDALHNVSNASSDVLENVTNRTLASAGPNASGGTGPGTEGFDGASSGPAAPDGEADRPRRLLRPELPRLAVTDDVLVVELRTLAVADQPTLAVPLAVDESSDSDGDGSRRSGGERDSSTTGDGADGSNDDAASAATTGSTTDDENGSADAAGDGADAAGASGSSATGFAGGVPVEFAPPLGTALFVVAVRPWLGLLSGVVAAALNWLGNAFVFLRYDRHDGSDPLEHETRERIHERVAETPGWTLTELSEALETPMSTVRHHVRVLERERVVVSRKLRGNRRIYPLGAEHAELAAALEEDSSAAVIAALQEHGRATVGDVVDRVEKSYSTVSYHLSRLAEEGLVEQEREGRKTLTRLDPDVASLLEEPDEPVAATPERSGREASAD